MAYVCDVVIALILAVSVISGCARGMVKTAFSCLTLVAAILLCWLFGPSVGDFVQKTPVYDDLSLKAQTAICEQFEALEQKGLADANESSLEFSESPMGETLEKLGFEVDSLYDGYEQAIKKGNENAKQKFAVDAAGKVMECLADAIGVLVTFVVSLIVLKLLSRLFDGIFKLPVLKTINKIGGFVLGLVLGVAGAFVLCTLIQILLPYIPENPVVYAGMENDTILYSLFLKLNPLLLILFG